MRVTIDLDDPAEIEILKSWNRLTNYGDGRVYGRISSSGEGIHLKVHGEDPENVELARMIAGDDPKRLRFDRDSRLKPKQILFSSKPNGDTAGEWTTDKERLIGRYRRQAPASVRYPDHPAARKSSNR